MRKTLIVALAFVAFVLPFRAAAQTAQAAPTAQPGSGFSIRFYEKKVYFLGDEIQIEADIENTTPDTLRFRMPDNRYFSLDFDVRTTTNIPLAHAKEFTTGRNSDQPVFFREVSLEPGERYSIVVDLSKFADFTDAGLYIVQATLYPDLFRGPDSSTMKSNRVTLNLKPPVVTAEERSRVEAETGALLAREALAPDDVVSSTITARQKSQWERYFLYLDLESLLRRNPDRDRVWRRSTEAAQRQMLDQFRQQLMQARIDQEISVLPTSFQVQKTTYDANEATVLVLERFKYPDYTELKQYTYHLKKSDRSWIIYDYEIRNQGTE